MFGRLKRRKGGVSDSAIENNGCSKRKSQEKSNVKLFCACEHARALVIYLKIQ